MPGAFQVEDGYQDEHTTTFSHPKTLSQLLHPKTQRKDEGVDTSADQMDDLTLVRGIDISRHPDKELLYLPDSHNIATLSEFRRVINDDEDGPLYFQAIAELVDYAVNEHAKNEKNVSSFRETIRDHDRKHLKSQLILRQALQELEDMEEQSRTNQAGCKRLQQELDAVEIQLAAERSSDFAHGIQTELREERDSHEETLHRLNAATKTIIQLRTELSTWGYEPRGTVPKELLTGTDRSAYAPWKYVIKEKLRLDAVIYTTEVARVSYALCQMSQPIFQCIHSWRYANENTLTVKEMFEEIEHYMGIDWMVSPAKRELNTIVIKPGESVNEYYHRIFTLWENAKTPGGERMEMFLERLKPSISYPLLGHKYANMRELLDAARSIEYINKNNITKNFPRNENSHPWNANSSEASGSSPRESGGSAVAAGAAAAGAKDKSGRTSNVNAKFFPTSTKPAGWRGTWYEPERYPETLQKEDRSTLSREGRCWGCRGSGHRRSDECCPYSPGV